MKLLILSDCHANADALRAVWEKEKDSDAILFAGDMLDFGFSPKETVRWFMEHRDRLYAVLGNHDEALLARRGEQVTDPYENFQKLNLSGLGEEEWEFLASLPHELTVTLGDTDFYICHMADELSADDCYVEGQLPTRGIRALFLERYAKKFPDSEAPNKVIVYGHSHQQWVLSAGERAQIINPGSLSYHFGSFEPVRCADYLVLEDGSYSLRHLNFDTEHLYALAERFKDPEHARLARAFFRK